MRLLITSSSLKLISFILEYFINELGKLEIKWLESNDLKMKMKLNSGCLRQSIFVGVRSHEGENFFIYFDL